MIKTGEQIIVILIYKFAIEVSIKIPAIDKNITNIFYKIPNLSSLSNLQSS